MDDIGAVRAKGVAIITVLVLNVIMHYYVIVNNQLVS